MRHHREKSHSSLVGSRSLGAGDGDTRYLKTVIAECIECHRTNRIEVQAEQAAAHVAMKCGVCSRGNERTQHRLSPVIIEDDGPLAA